MKKKTLEERIQHLEDIQDIQNLMGRYSYLHTAGKHKETAELFAENTPGVKAEFPAWGIYDGYESIKRVFVGVHSFQDGDRVGIMRMHTMSTPIVEVAEDGLTARGAWISPGHETMRDENSKHQAYWAWCKYGCDFVKEDGNWKIWHLRIYGIFMTPYNKSWVEVDKPAIPEIPDNLKADRPGHEVWTYSTNSIYPVDEPALPEPYETWDDSLSCVR